MIGDIPRCERWLDDQKLRACGKVATTTRPFEEEDVPLCFEHADDADGTMMWAGIILALAEWTGEDPKVVAKMVGPRPDKRGGA